MLLKSQRRKRGSAPEDAGCSEAANYEQGHGLDGHCVIRDAPCPRKCLIKHIHRLEAALRGEAIRLQIEQAENAHLRKCVLAPAVAPTHIQRLRKQAYERRGRTKPHGFKFETHCGNPRCIAEEHLKLVPWAT